MTTFVAGLANRESRIRNLAKRRGYRVHRSREWRHVPHSNNFGHYMLIDAAHNWIVLGSCYDASLSEIENFLGGT